MDEKGKMEMVKYAIDGWRDSSAHYETVRAEYVEKLARGMVASDMKSDSGRKTEAEGALKAEKIKVKKAKIGMDYSYYTMQLAFAEAGVQFVGAEIR